MEKCHAPHDEVDVGLARVQRLMDKLHNDETFKLPADEFWTRFCTAAVDSGYRMAVVAPHPAADGPPMPPIAYAAVRETSLEHIDLGWTTLANPAQPASTCAERRSWRVAQRMLDTPCYAPWQEDAVREGYQSAMAVWDHTEDGASVTLALFADHPDAFEDPERTVLVVVLSCILAATAASRRASLERELTRYRSFLETIHEVVFTVESDGVLSYVNPAVEHALGYRPEDILGRDLRSVLEPEDLLLLAAHFRHGAPELITGVECNVRGKSGDVKQFSIIAAPFAPQPGVFMGIARDLTEQRRIENQLFDAFEGTIMALGDVMVARDAYTAGHQVRVAQLAAAIARELALEKDKIRAVRYAGLVHDIGKMSIPSQILAKPARLTPAEQSMLENHPKIGSDVLSKISFPWPIARIVLEHHERVDGSGYPNGLTGRETLVESRILAVADVVEAMSSHRPYRPALGIGAALQEISEKSGTLYDGDVVKACLRLFRRRGYRLDVAKAVN